MNIIETAHLFHARGLNALRRGVLAGRLGAGGLICITPAHADFKSIEHQDLCRVDLDGTAVDGTSLQELPENLDFYLKVFQDRADATVLAHVHPPHASAFADRSQLFELLENPAQSPIREFIKVECRDCPSRFTGLCSCRADIRKSYAGADALLVKQDGIVVVAADLDSLIIKVESLERSAEKSGSPTSSNPLSA